MNNYWCNAPEWAGAVIRSNLGTEYYVSQWGGISARLRVGSNEVDEDRADMIEPHNWSLVETRRKPWTAEGLPPVGIEIEAMMRRSMHDTYAWHRAKVVHGPLPGSEGEVLVFCLETTSPAWVDEFRPVRTPEQIAAEKREATAKELYERTFGHPASSRWEGLTQERKNVFLNAIDEGWQKVAP